MASNKPKKLVFLSIPAPASYVTGLGRGASGFTTRSDIGPARDGPSAEVIATAQARRSEEAEVDPDQFQDPDNEYGLFAGTTYEQDDKEVDKIYQQVDEAMDARRWVRRWAAVSRLIGVRRGSRAYKDEIQLTAAATGHAACVHWLIGFIFHREVQEQINLAKHRAERPKIQQQFADLKRGLSVATDEEWETLPEVDNLTRKKRRKMERSFAVPDSVLVGDQSKSEYENSLDNSSVVLKSKAEIGDIKHARMLFNSLVKSNPKHSPGWIAAACLEEHAGRMVAARKIIKAGCEQCPKSEDVWLQSVKIWIAAADLEHDVKVKKCVLRKALELIPNSVRLWKETVNLESSAADTRILLSHAVKVIPLSVKLWLVLARLETPERVQSVLGKARKAVPTSYEIWIAAGRLLEQEARNKSDAECETELAVVDKMIVAGVKELKRHQVLLTREQWLKERGMEIEEDRLDTWVGDAESAEARGMVGTAQAILAKALRVFPGRKLLWIRAGELEKANGTRESLDAILTRAVDHCPQAEVMWLMAAKEKWMAGDVPAAREVLERAFVANKESEQIWLAAVKLEAENNELGVARELLVHARTVADTERIWMKSAIFERQQGQLDAALKTLATALTKFPKFAKLYMIQGQILQLQGKFPAARASFTAGLKACPKEPTLWILASRLEETDKKSIKARAILDKARLVNPANDVLWAEAVFFGLRQWAEAVGVEERSGGAAQGKAMLARSLQECPTSGLLWSMSIWAEP
ncbi:PRP1 splicing factor, N-terminal-domain-containing protein [Mycena albidolilacea]|uniref:PRP1 splicing factor, N-terminal-domain-containing protein n=1 Tax=Mycena albidolilacea TaxID=1033008 RepID=A0AAD7ESI4_9AGAR|nr:PRP1 splicing factor, N-terminal-domain-containing protein [Mycena albidolilacea]